MAAAGLGATQVVANGAPGEQQPSRACEAVDRHPHADAERVVNGAWAKGRETTEFFADGTYRVARCNSDGSLAVQQHVGPVRVPGGGTEMLVIAETRPFSGGRLVERSPLYGDPRDPAFIRLWERDRALILADVLSPTDSTGGR